MTRNSNLWQLASYQEKLLQAYRLLQFIVLGTAIIGSSLIAGFACLAKNGNQFGGLLILLLLFTLLMSFLILRFRKLIHSRVDDINYAQKQLLKAEQALPEEERIFTQFKQFQKQKNNLEQRDETNQTPLEAAEIHRLIQKEKGHTRFLLDSQIPVLVLIYIHTLNLLTWLRLLF